MKIILAVLFSIIACATAQSPCTAPSEPRQIFPHPTDCSRYIICIFGRDATYLCPTHINHFNACTMNCTSSNNMCFNCVDITTIGTTTTVVDGTTTTPIDGTTTPVDGTTTTPVDVTTTAPVTDEPTFIPTPPPETTAGPDTTTTVAGDTTISVPTAPIVPPTPPTNP